MPRYDYLCAKCAGFTSRRKALGMEERSAQQPGVVGRASVPHLVDRDRREQQTPRRFQHAHGPYPWTVGH